MTQPTLARRLGLVDAVTIGLGSMIGAGIFAAFAPAARAAGGAVLGALAIAAVVAFCNATSSAQLAARYPASGGTYVYGREELGAWPGFLAGWGFVIGKTASCAAMALTFATYAVGTAWARPVAIAAVVALAALNYRGVTRTALATKIIVALVLAVLAFVVVACVASGLPRTAIAPAGTGDPPVGPYGLLQGAGLLFFAFAGYARIATMGEEVREPARTIPRAIVIAFALAVLVYALVGVVLLATLGPRELATSPQPVADAVARTGIPGARVIVRVGAALASLGALLALIAGIGRTTLAMARERDLPGVLAAVHPRFQVPHRAEVAVAVVVCLLLLAVDLRGAIGFSSFGVLLYYAVANAAALHQREGRRYPRALQVLGLAGCLALVGTLPWQAVAAGVAVFAVGAAYRLLRRRLG